MFDACVPSTGRGGGVPQFGNEKGGGDNNQHWFQPCQPLTVSPQVNTLLLKKKKTKEKNSSCQVDSNNSNRDIECGVGK